METGQSLPGTTWDSVARRGPLRKRKDSVGLLAPISTLRSRAPSQTVEARHRGDGAQPGKSGRKRLHRGSNSVLRTAGRRVGPQA